MRAIASRVLLICVALAASGCYLTHVARGQLRLLRARQPIEQLLADAATPPDLRARLVLVLDVRDHARRLGLEVGGQYTSFAEWPGDRVATVIVAARPGEVLPAGFRYPLVGRLPYKGFFDPERADTEAERLRARGLDVCISPVRAYSTLGWLDDPVTGPLLRGPEGSLVETLIHELVHATAYWRGDPDLSEGVAAFVGQEGAVHFYAERGDEALARRERERVADDRLVRAALLDFRSQIVALGERLPAGTERNAARAALERDLRTRVAGLPLASREAEPLAEELRLNDACLAWYGTYYADTPRFAALLDALGGDLPAFVARLRTAAGEDDPRAALLGR
jgi:predicted aminopeptidase